MIPTGKTLLAARAHQATGDTQLCLEEGELVDVLKEINEHWIEIKKNSGDTGLVLKLCFDL